MWIAVLVDELNLGESFYLHRRSYRVESFLYDAEGKKCAVIAVRSDGSSVMRLSPDKWVELDGADYVSNF